MNASSLLPKAPALIAAPARPVLSPEQIAARAASQKRVAISTASQTLLQNIAALKSQFETGVARIQALLDKNPHATRAEILAKLTPEQQAAFAQVAEWAYTGLAAFQPPAEKAPAPAEETSPPES